MVCVVILMASHKPLWREMRRQLQFRRLYRKHSCTSWGVRRFRWDLLAICFVVWLLLMLALLGSAASMLYLISVWNSGV